MSGSFFRAAGVDPDEGATQVFVWSRDKRSEDKVFLGSGHVVQAGRGLPPGVPPGQFSVIFSLPPECSPEEVVVTSDKDGDKFLTDVRVTPCVAPDSFPSAAPKFQLQGIPGGAVGPDSGVNHIPSR